MSSFQNKKQLKIVITLGSEKFDEAGNDQITLIDYRASVEIDLAGGVQRGSLRAKIFGMSKSDMSKITTYPINIATMRNNLVSVFTIDGDAETLVFSGNIVRAWPEFQNAPDVFLNLQAQAALGAALRTAEPRSYKAPVNVALVISQIASAMGYAFENNGVDVILSDTYLSNTNLEQIKTIAQASNIDFLIDRNTVVILKKGASRKNQIPLLTKDTGLLSYPSFDGTYLTCMSLYNPSIVQLGLISIQSEVIQATGEWQVLSMMHRLESETPDGAWFSIIRAVSPLYYK